MLQGLAGGLRHLVRPGAATAAGWAHIAERAFSSQPLGQAARAAAQVRSPRAGCRLLYGAADAHIPPPPGKPVNGPRPPALAHHCPQTGWAAGALRGGSQLRGGVRECLRQPPATQSAVLGLRQYSVQSNLREASEKVRTALEAPAKAVQRARAAAAQTSAAVYSKLPRQVGGQCGCRTAAHAGWAGDEEPQRGARVQRLLSQSNLHVCIAPSNALCPARPSHLQVQQWIDAAQTPGKINRVISLQLEAFWQQHGRTVMVAGALGAAYVLW